MLLEYGILPDALHMGHTNVLYSVWTAVNATYGPAYAKWPVDRLPCGISYAAAGADGGPRALTEEQLAGAFADSSGIAPTAGVSLVAPDAQGRVRATNLGDGKLAVCLRALRDDPDVQAGLREVELSGKVGQRPVIILHGRADGLIAVNHSSRAYYAVNQRDSNARAELKYYEVEHAQHFDAFLALSDFAATFVPLQPHLSHAMDLMSARLRKGTPLPPSQVIRSKPRASHAGTLAPLTTDNLGTLRTQPGPDAITFDGQTLRVPK